MCLCVCFNIKKLVSFLCQGGSDQALTREKAAQSVTVVSLTFLLLTLPSSVYYVLSFVATVYNQVTGHDYAKLYFFNAILQQCCQLLPLLLDREKVQGGILQGHAVLDEEIRKRARA